MENNNVTIQAIFLAASSIASFFWGGNSELLYALLLLMALDYISGISAAAVLRQVSSYIGFRGIAKKMLILIIVSISGLLDRYLLVSEGFVQGMVTLFYISNECVSILENAGAAGIPIPKKLSDIMGKLKHDAANSGSDSKKKK